MKSSFIKYTLIALLFILLIGIVLFAMRPVYYNFASKLNAFAYNVLNSYTKDLGIKISYNSLSPSLFSSIQFEGIKVKNAETGETLIEFDKISLKYNILKLLKGEYASAIKEFIIEGGIISFSTESDVKLLNKIIEKFSKKDIQPKTAKPPRILNQPKIPPLKENIKIPQAK